VNVRRLAAAIAPVIIVAASCGDSHGTGAATTNAPTTVATTVAPDGFCEAMDHVVALLRREETRTPPAQVQRTFEDALPWFEQAQRNAPNVIADDVDAYKTAYDEYVYLLRESGFNLDVVFSTPEGQQLAVDTSHTLTPAIVDYVIGECGLSFES
jgi:hypothetical protein